MKWCAISPLGQLLSCGSCPDLSTEENFAHIPGDIKLNIPDDVGLLTHYFDGIEFVKFPARPSDSHAWDWGAKVWAEDIEAAKTAKSVNIHTSCGEQIVSGFESSALGTVFHYPAKELDQQNLLACVTDSLYPDLPVDWTTKFWCADPLGVWEFRPHTATQIQQVGREGKAVIMAAMGKNELLQTQIALATSIEDLNQINW